MKMKIIAVLLFCAGLVSFTPYAFSEYATLDGKYVELHGPFCWDYLGVARDEAACDAMMRVLARHDKREYFNILNSFRILRVTKNTKATILELQVSEGRAKVLVLTGLHKGFSGWVPLSLLDGNEHRPMISEYKS
ncbi:MAG: hypothetical protein ABH865_06970 [Candidatus Omnitrophota bacterium]|nr:hypothetical protein [Candidatus Omnitrophota bacterium]